MRLVLDDVAIPEWFEGWQTAAHNDYEIFGPAPDNEVICFPLNTDLSGIIQCAYCGKKNMGRILTGKVRVGI